MTHHARFARSFARTVPTPEANKSLSIGMFRFGSVRCGSRERSACVGARDVFLKIPTILVTNIHVAHVGFVKSARVRIELNCARRRPGWTPFVGR